MTGPAGSARTSSLLVRSRRTWALLLTLTPREFRVRYRESYLDVAWAIITPLVLLAVYGVILTQALGVEGGCAPYLITAWIGLVLWTFFSSAVQSASTSLLRSSDLMAKVYFPREALPLADVGVTIIDLALGLGTVVVLGALQGVRPSVTAVAVLPALVVLVLWTAALAVITAAATVFVRDIAHGVALVLRAGFFASPVMYDVSTLPEWLRWTASVNPVAVVITAVRDAVLCGRWPDLILLVVQGAAGGALLLVAVFYVRRVEARMVDVL